MKIAVDLALLVLGAWAGAGGAIVVISMLKAGSEAVPRSPLDRISIDEIHDAI